MQHFMWRRTQHRVHQSCIVCPPLFQFLSLKTDSTQITSQISLVTTEIASVSCWLHSVYINFLLFSCCWSLGDLGVTVYSSLFQVFGVGVPNPYRLRPFLGARVPLNFSFSTLINMHNPYNSPLQVSIFSCCICDLLIQDWFVGFHLIQFCNYTISL